MKHMPVAHFIIGAWCLAAASAKAEQQTLDLNELIEKALAHNCEIAAFEQRTKALWERPSQVRAWDDPQLTFGVLNAPTDDFDFDKQEMTQKYVSIMQKIPFPGISALKAKTAVEDARKADSELEDIKIRVVRNIKQAYYQLYVVDEALKITAANERILEKFVEITKAKYEVGRGLQEDILKAQVELYKMQEKKIDLQQKQKTLHAQINNLLSRDQSSVLSGEPVLTTTDFTYSAAELEEMAIAGNPLLRAAKHEVEKGEAEYALAKKMYFPQFTVTAAYGQRDDRPRARPTPTRVTDADGNTNIVTTEPLSFDTDRPDFFTFLVGINIPLWFKSKQRSGVAEAYHRSAQAQSHYENVKNEICFKIRDLTSKICKGKELIALYRDSIIPRANQSLDADIAAYQVGKIDFLALLDSQIRVFNYELQHRIVMADYENDVADIEAVVGRRLF